MVQSSAYIDQTAAALPDAQSEIRTTVRASQAADDLSDEIDVVAIAGAGVEIQPVQAGARGANEALGEERAKNERARAYTPTSGENPTAIHSDPAYARQDRATLAGRPETQGANAQPYPPIRDRETIADRQVSSTGESLAEAWDREQLNREGRNVNDPRVNREAGNDPRINREALSNPNHPLNDPNHPLHNPNHPLNDPNHPLHREALSNLNDPQFNRGEAQRNREALEAQQREAVGEPFNRDRGGLREVHPNQPANREALNQEQLNREAALKREREGLNPASLNREVDPPFKAIKREVPPKP